jgi:glycosyltransferase involved in cell wall biosynthesis
MKQLSLHHTLYLICVNDKMPEEQDLRRIQEICAEVHVFPLSGISRAVSLCRSLFTKLPFQVAYFYNPAVKKRVLKLFQEIQPDHIFCQLVRMSEYAKDVPFPKTLDYMDAFSKGMQRRAIHSRFPKSQAYKIETKRLEKYEVDIFEYFDHHSVISRQDAEELPYSSRIKVIPNGVNTEYFTPGGSQKSFDLGFVGNLGYTPNIEAVHYLMNQINPLLKEELKVLIAGARPGAGIQQYNSEQVTVLGWLDDIREAYKKIGIFVAPLFHGIGQQNKILEAMSMGIPCVTNSMVNNAIGAKDGRHILIADTASEFANAINALRNDQELYRSISEKSRTFVAQNFSWREQGLRLAALMEGVSYH